MSVKQGTAAKPKHGAGGVFLSAGLAGGAALAAVLMLLAVWMVKHGFSARAIFWFSTFALCAGCLFTAFGAAAARKGGALLCGAGAFALYAAALTAAAVLTGGPLQQGKLLLRIGLLLASGLAGGCAGLAWSERKARRR